MIIKKSIKRDRILKVIRDTDTHPTAEWVYLKLKDEIPELSLATVYRNLEQLTSSGEILKLEGGGKTARFDGCTKGHYHLSCEKCGKVCDLPIKYDSNLAYKMTSETDFLVTGYSINFRGVCPECKKTYTDGEDKLK